MSIIRYFKVNYIMFDLVISLIMNIITIYFNLIIQYLFFNARTETKIRQIFLTCNAIFASFN